MLLIAVSACSSSGAGPGDEVVVIYNTRVPESKGVAAHYARLRQVPTNQIFGFSLSSTEEMSRTEFRDSLQRPLAKALEQKKLWRMGPETLPGTNGRAGMVITRVKESKIRYAVLCYGVPLHINEDPGIKEKVDETRAEMRRNEAAVDSELALLPGIEQNIRLAGPIPNVFYGITNGSLCHPTNGLLMVSRIDGPSAVIARGLVDKAIQAENEGLWGRGYFDLRGMANPNFKPGEDTIRGASEVVRRMGFEPTLDENPGTFSADFPMSHIAFYCGWYEEHVGGPFTRAQVEFMPGAFAYHLHSFSAVPFRSATNRWAGPLLAKGATATMGCVAEPFLLGTPDVATFLSRFIVLGFSYGEAAHAAQPMLSWQTTIVGDPLYRPFATTPKSLHEELERKNSDKLEFSFLRLINVNHAEGKRLIELAEFLENVPATKQSAVLTERLADFYTGLGKPSSALDTYQKALKLNPSPQQRVRLRLIVADKLIALKRSKDAIDQLRKLYQETPDYPARFTLQKRKLNLAIELGEKEEITRCVQEMQQYGEDETKRQAEEERKKAGG